MHNKYFILVLFVVILTNFSHVTIFFINISCFIFLCHYIWYTWCDYLITKKRPFSCQFKKRHCFLWCSSHKSNDASFSGAKYLLTAASETALCPHITGCADGIIRRSVFVGKMIGICHTDRSPVLPEISRWALPRLSRSLSLRMYIIPRKTAYILLCTHLLRHKIRPQLLSHVFL